MRASLRPATREDAPYLLDLVNTHEVKFWSGRDKDIAPGEHRDWLLRALANSKHYVLMAEIAGQPVGYGRLEYVTEARVSFAVDDGWRGQGVGRGILEGLENYRHKDVPLVAYVHPGNTASLRAFLSQGYILDEMRTEKGVMWQILRKS